LLKKLERELMVSAHKFGVIYCKDGQISEDEMLNNGACPLGRRRRRSCCCC